jgi:hypothetical protein
MTIPTSMHRHTRLRAAVVLVSLAFIGACSESTVPDFNNPSEDNYQDIRSSAQLSAMITGLADADRLSHDFQILSDETIARDVYRLDGAESRYITQPLGASLSPTVFIGAGVFTQPYRTIRSSENLIRAARNYDGDVIDAAGRSAVIGYAQTIKALQYMRLIEQRDTVGISIYTTPGSINPLRCKADILNYISAVLDSAATDLTAAGDFELDLPGGFAGFTVASDFLTFNRALKAKNEVYRAFQNYSRNASGVATGIDAAALASAQAALDASFLDVANLRKGVYHLYSSTAGDYLNPNYGPSIYRINPRVVYESEGVSVTTDANGDTTAVTVPDARIRAKVETNPTDNCRTIRDATSCFLDKVNDSPTHSLPIIRSDELYLIQAEIYWGLGQYANALAIVNDLRRREGGFTTDLTEAGLGGFTTGAGQLNLLRAILREKRNQLLFESTARFVDYRMFGLLPELGRERGKGARTDEDTSSDDFRGFDPIPVFPIPTAEQLARGGDLAKTCGP